MKIARLVVPQRPALHGLLDDRLRHAPRAVRAGRCSRHRQLQRVERRARVAVGQVHQRGQGVVVEVGVQPAEAPLAVRQCHTDDARHLVVGQ